MPIKIAAIGRQATGNIRDFPSLCSIFIMMISHILNNDFLKTPEFCPYRLISAAAIGIPPFHAFLLHK
jgi:hypothetical protein